LGIKVENIVYDYNTVVVEFALVFLQFLLIMFKLHVAMTIAYTPIRFEADISVQLEAFLATTTTLMTMSFAL
jgi:hypothetical protein